jgi:hypothetical protein
MHIVVSRFNEDVRWLKQLKLPYTVYNKGKTLSSIDNIKVENIGREADTFVQYILSNYQNLPENVVFAQGNPFDHCIEFIPHIMRQSNNVIENIFPLCNHITAFDVTKPCSFNEELNTQEVLKEIMPNLKETNFLSRMRLDQGVNLVTGFANHGGLLNLALILAVGSNT